MSHETRYKAVVIPKIGNKYVVVRDKVSSDLTFVVGGCKLRELKNLPMCAVRELSEETHGSIVVDPYLVRKPSFSFSSKYRSKAEKAKNGPIEVTMIYNVYIFDLDASWSKIQKDYDSKKFLSNEEKETNGIYLMTCKELENSEMWKFMKENVLQKLCRW
jgi:hypothetical protein